MFPKQSVTEEANQELGFPAQHFDKTYSQSYKQIVQIPILEGPSKSQAILQTLGGIYGISKVLETKHKKDNISNKVNNYTRNFGCNKSKIGKLNQSC